MSARTPESHTIRKIDKSTIITLMLLLIVAMVVIVWGLGKNSLYDWDEAIYAQVSKEMVQSGDWLRPHWGDKPWMEKPPLYMWMTSIFYFIFGISEFGARAPSAFSGIGLILLTYLIGKQVKDKSVGILASVIMLTNYQFIDFARFGTTDITLTFFNYLTVYSYLRLKDGNKLWWYLIWISFALGIMVKSFAGLIIPLAVMIVLTIDKGIQSAFRSRHFWIGIVIALLLVIPWHTYMVLEYGQDFIDKYFKYHIIDRFARPIEENTGSGFFYIEVLQKFFYPWFYLTPFALALNIKENIKKPSSSFILLIIIILVSGLYTVARTKISWYILPVYPALSIIIASMVMQAFKSYNTVAFSGFLISITVTVLTVPREYVLIFGSFVALFLIILTFVKKQLSLQVIVAICFCFFAVVGINKLRVLYQGGESPAARLAKIAGISNPNSQKPLIVLESNSVELWEPTPRFYSNRPTLPVQSLDDIAKYTKGKVSKEIIFAKNELESLQTNYEIQILKEADPLIYANITSRVERR